YPQRRHRSRHAGSDRERGRDRRKLDHGRRLSQHHRRLVPGVDGFRHLQAREIGGAGMIDHVSVGVADLERAARFYEAALAVLGLSRLVTRPGTVGFGKAYPEFWINFRAAMSKVPHESGTHICLRARTTAEVDAFHAAALGAGGRSDGPP